jgi:hypothetical protein
MLVTKSLKSLMVAGALALLAGLSTSASAATVTFGDYATTTNNPGPNPTPLVTVNDDTAGFLSFSISSSGVAGMLSGVFFDISGITLSVSDILNESIALANFGTDTGNVGGGVNMNGTYTDTNATNNPTFDFGLRIAQTDVSVTPFTFQISSALLGLDDLEGVGLRFQSVPVVGSAKIIGTPLSAVPLPAAGFLLIGALGGLAALRRRRNLA